MRFFLGLALEVLILHGVACVHIGVKASAGSSQHDIGFGYVGGALQHKPPAFVSFEQTNSSAQTKGDLVFGVRSTTNGSDVASERLRLTSDGQIKISGNVSITESMFSSGGYYSSSDERLKIKSTAIQPQLALKKVRQMIPISFEFDHESFPEAGFPPGEQVGFSAQDIERIIPQLVKFDDAGFRAVQYERIAVYAVAAIKHMADTLEWQQARIEILENSIR
jgi:hypothetical protein